MHIDRAPLPRFDMQMSTYRQIVVDFIREAETQSGRKISNLAKQAEIAHTTFTRFLANGDYKYIPKIDKLLAISRVSGVPLPPEIGGAEGRDLIEMPLVSWVSAGKLADSTSQLEAEDTLSAADLPPGRYFATRVVGDSMDLYSPEGSIVIVNRNENTPLPGRAYIFNHRGQTTYKVFKDDPVRLAPHSTNSALDAIFPRKEDDWSVVGRVRRTILDL